MPSPHEVPLGPADLGNVPALWEALDRTERELDRAESSYRADRYKLTDRRFDEATPRGTYTYINAYSHIAIARECHRAFVDSLQSGIRPHAVWTAIRPSFESAFYAAWALDPDDSRERLQRGLRIAWKQHTGDRDRSALAGEMVDLSGIELTPELLQDRGRENQRVKDREASLESEAGVLHLKKGTLKARINVLKEVQALSSLGRVGEMAPVWAAYVWRQLSATTHGDTSAMRSLAHVDKVGVIDGGAMVKLSVNDDSLQNALRASAVMQSVAMQLYTTRTTARTARGGIN